MINWKKESEEKPPYNVQVLVWNDCEKCRKGILDDHFLDLFDNSSNSFEKGIYKRALRENDPDYEDCLELFKKDYWIPFKPSHWSFVNPPNFENKGELNDRKMDPESN